MASTELRIQALRLAIEAHGGEGPAGATFAEDIVRAAEVYVQFLQGPARDASPSERFEAWAKADQARNAKYLGEDPSDKPVIAKRDEHMSIDDLDRMLRPQFRHGKGS